MFVSFPSLFFVGTGRFLLGLLALVDQLSPKEDHGTFSEHHLYMLMQALSIAILGITNSLIGNTILGTG